MATKTTKKTAPAETKAAAPAKAVAPKKETASKPAAKTAKSPAKSPAADTSVSTKTASATAAKPAAKKPAATAEPAKKTAPKAAPVPVTKPVAAKNQKWDEIRLQLLQLKEATLQEITRSIKNGSVTTVGEETTGDIYDQASSERDRELELILSDRERQKLHNIDDALLRMDEGEYGICEECDEEIPLGRLKAMPFTRHCVKCKSDLERLQAQTRRFEEDRAYREIPLGEEEEG